MARIEEKQISKRYGDYLREAAAHDPTYRTYLKIYRKSLDVCIPPRIGDKEGEKEEKI